MEHDDADETTQPQWGTAPPTQTTTRPPGDSEHRPPPLTRSSSDRLLAGVAGGLGRYFGVDPVLVRIALVVLAIAGGTGVVLYLLGWLLIPEEGGGESVAISALRGRDGRARTVGVVGALALAAALVTSPFRDGSWPDGFLWPIVFIGLGFALLHSRRLRPPAHTDQHPSGSSWPASPAPAEAAVARPPTLTAYLVGGLTMLAGGAALFDLSGAIHVTAAGFLASALVLSGVALVAGGVRGRIGAVGLVALVLAGALAATLAVPVSLDGGIGNRISHPVGSADIRAPYRLGVGNLTLDLSDVRPDGVLPVTARVGVGRLLVIVPSGANVITRGRAGVGDVDVFGGTEGGLSVDRTSVDHETASGTFNLDLEVGVGHVEVQRAGS